jgi:peptide/nickel transport system permease protein
VLNLIIRRLLALVPLLFLVTFMAYGIILLVPGDPAIAIAGENATAEQVEATRERLGLNDPFLVQYGRWVGNAVQGDLGSSLFATRDVRTAVFERLPVTLSLTFSALFLAVLVALPAGILAALRKGTWIDRGATVTATLGIAMPNFWLGLLLVIVFAINNPWFPATGYVAFGDSPTDWARHMFLPAVALGAAACAEITRQLRSAVIDVVEQDYVRTARAKGLMGPSVIGKHVLKNAAVPVVTVLGLQVTRLLGGAVIIEQVFALPGLGQLAVSAVFNRDIPLILGIVLVAALIAIFINLLVDLSYGWFNPKVRPQ